MAHAENYGRQLPGSRLKPSQRRVIFLVSFIGIMPHCGSDETLIALGNRNSQRLAQLSSLKASYLDAFDQFGHSVSLSEDGTTLAVEAPKEDSGEMESNVRTKRESGIVRRKVPTRCDRLSYPMKEMNLNWPVSETNANFNPQMETTNDTFKSQMETRCGQRQETICETLKNKHPSVFSDIECIESISELKNGNKISFISYPPLLLILLAS